MPEIRFDALNRGFSIIATERAKRPLDFRLEPSTSAVPEKDDRCPFCPGNESETPPEIWANRHGGETDGPGWTVRVVPNKFPALLPRPSGEDDEKWRVPPFPEIADMTLYWEAPGVGSHEVVVESPYHNGTLGNYAPEHVKDVLNALKSRCLALYETEGIGYVQVFKNHGKTAGASLSHPHFQIVALPVVPTVITQEGQRMKEYESKTRRCLICDLVERETEKDVRVVLKSESFIVFCPFASRYSYETLIVPREHASGLTDLNDAALDDLASTLVKLFGAYESMFPSLPYNMVVHGLPSRVRDKRGWPYHAHIHVYPRLNVEAGLELGTGAFINPTPPELAAREFISVLEA